MADVFCATGPGHPAGELYLQQEILGLSGRGLQRGKRRRRSLQQPLPRAGHRQRPRARHSVPQPADPAGTDCGISIWLGPSEWALISSR